MKGDPTRLRPVRGLISDLDGTLLAGSRSQPGLAAFLGFLRHNDIGLRVVTNNSTRAPEAFAAKLAAAGAEVQSHEVLTSAQATAAYLAERLPKAAPLFVVGESGLVAALSDAGFRLLEDSREPAAAVVVGGDRAITHDKLKHAIRHAQRGALLVGTNPDLLVPVEDGFAPEAGVLLAAIAAGSGASPVVIGKPERPLLELALRSMGCEATQAAILGDRLDTDILGGQRLGLLTILVTTGIDGEAAIEQKETLPDLVVSDLDELAQLWGTVLKE